MPEIGTTMQLLHFLAEVFINTFGITQPSTPAQQRRVSLTLGGFLLAFISRSVRYRYLFCLRIASGPLSL